MDAVYEWLARMAGAVSHLLEPIVFLLDRLHGEVRGQLELLHVPFRWRQPIITGAWVLALFLLVRTLQGWVRVVALVLILLVLFKLYDFMPPPVAPRRP